MNISLLHRRYNYLLKNKVGITMAVLLTTLMVLSSMTIATSVAQVPLDTTPETSVGLDSTTSVDLGSAENFIILAKTGISTTGTTSIVGNLGVSPIDSTAITGFNLILDASGEFATSSLVTGNIYASDYAAPTPSMLTTAVSDMETAYTAAAGRTSADHTELGSGEIGGMTLAPGLYKWSSAVTISTDVTLDGSATDVWVFQIAETLQISNDVTVHLTGGAEVQNIFWQVGGQVTLDTSSVFNGIILGKTSIVMNTGATLYGRALAQGAVTLDANSVSLPSSDSTAPTVSSTVPADAATDISLNSKLSATFSEKMDIATMTNATFIVHDGTTSVTGTVAYSSTTATFTPEFELTADTVYTANITTGAKDLAGNALASNHTWSFTTGQTADTTAPTVSSTVPASDATDVVLSNALTATFSEAMDPSTITTSTFILHDGTTSVSGTVTYSSSTATFTPAVDLEADTVYTANITTGVMDLAGNQLASNYTWSFDTSLTEDSTTEDTSDTTDDTTDDTTEAPLDTTEDDTPVFELFFVLISIFIVYPIIQAKRKD